MANLQMDIYGDVLFIASGGQSDDLYPLHMSFHGDGDGMYTYFTQAQAEQLKQFLNENF